MKQFFSKHYWGDKDVQLMVGQILRTGVLAASIVIVFGAVLYLWHHGQDPVPDYRHFVGEPKSNIVITDIISAAFSGNVPQVILFGVLLLIFTPIVRVIGSLYGFILEKDRLYIFVTLIVLAVILFSILSDVKG